MLFDQLKRREFIVTGAFGSGLALVAIFVVWRLIVDLVKFITDR